MKKKLLSVLLVLCMVMALMPTMALAAQTTGLDFTSDSTPGNGYSWDSGTNTLTLYGVDINVSAGNAIKLPAGSTIELVGYNKLTAGRDYATLSCAGNLTIGGSGILEVSNTSGSSLDFGIKCSGILAINGGYIKTNKEISTYDMHVSGGYVEASKGINVSNLYAQAGGYVKVTAETGDGITSGSIVTVQGGYLEATGGHGINSSWYGVTNDGGVIKATGTTGNGIVGTLTAVKGVTIATGSGANAGVSDAITLPPDSEKVWERTGDAGEYSDSTYSEVTLDSSYKTAKTSIVVAKEAYATKQTLIGTLDSVYIDYSAGGGNDQSIPSLTITGGSYIENHDTDNGVGCTIAAGATLSGTGTLVVKSPRYGIYTNNSSYSGTGTLIGVSAKYGIAGTGTDLKVSDGHVIGVGGTEYGVTGIDISGGSVIGVSASGNGVNYTTISNASVTGVAGGNYGVSGTNITDSKVSGYSSSTGTSAEGVSVMGRDSISGDATVVGAYCASGTTIVCTEVTDAGLAVKGASGLSETFSTATYGSGTYKVGDSAAKVVYIAAAAADDTAPILIAGAVTRTSDTVGTVKFTSDEAGQYYYKIVGSGVGKPTITTTGAGTDCTTSETTITLNSLTAGAKDIYIVVKDAAGNVSADTFKIAVPAYVVSPANTPSCGFSFDGASAGNLTSTTEQMKYSLDGGSNWTNCSEDSTNLSAVLASITENNDIKVKDMGNGATTSESLVQTIDITKAATPNLTPTQPSTIGGTGSIPTTTAHEFSSTNATSSFNACTGAQTGLAVGTYYVRVAATGTVLASESQTITINAYSAPTSGGGGGGGGTPSLVTEIKSDASNTASNLDRLISENKELTVTGADGAKLVFDTDALKGIDKQTSGNVTVKIEDVTKQHTEMGKTVFSLTVVSGDKTIVDFGGSVTVSLPYELKDGEKAEDVTVWYLASDGSMTEIPCTYDAKTKLATFTTTHFSVYVVGVDNEWSNPFSDVKESDWFYGDVAYVAQKGMMQGTSETTFAPHADTSRGMIVTILYRLEGEPTVTGANPFDDVASGKYYTNAIIWAAENSIVSGYGEGKFGLNDDITREQMAAILYRYAQYKGYDTTASTDLGKFADADQISGYATTAMGWANANELITGKGNNILDPQGSAERCQVAAILHRFCENIVK